MEIVEQLEGLVKGAVDAAGVIRSFPGTVRVVSHYDADGIASAAILVKSLEREGKEFRVSFVKQLSEEIVKEVGEGSEMLVVFSDLGSGFLSEISGHLLGRGKRVVILDHHQVQGEVLGDGQGEVLGDGRQGEVSESSGSGGGPGSGEVGSLYHVNPVLHGIEEDISGSGASYLMARAMSPVNKDLSELAIVGAIGDSQTGSIGPHWGLLGINKEILKDAQSTGKIRLEKGLRLWGRYGRPIHKALQYSMDPYIEGVSGSESGAVQFLQELGIELKEPTGEWRSLASLSEEENRRLATGMIKERIHNGEDNPEWIFGDVYELMDKKESFRDANEFATMLNACGKSGNAWIGVALCLNDENFSQDMKRAMTAYRREIGKALELVRKSPGMVRSTRNADYILAGGKVSEHVISNVASIIEKSCLRPCTLSGADGCLVPEGACHKPVFAFADTEDGQVKVSGRASDSLVKEGISMKELMSRIAGEFGGQGGGHAGAAGATIPRGSEERFISTVEKILSADFGHPQGNAVQVAVPSTGKQEQHDVVHAFRLPSGREDVAGNVDNNIKESVQIQGTGSGSVPVSDGSQELPEREDVDSKGVLAFRLRHEVVRKEEKGYGRIHQGTGAEGEGKGREEAGQGREEGHEGEEGRGTGSKEMERKGLVRYLFS